MAQFYGRISGNRGEATRQGSKDSGISAAVETWKSVIRTSQQFLGGSKSNRASLSIEGKHGGTALHVGFNSDDIMEAYTAGNGGVKDALDQVSLAFDELDSALIAYRQQRGTS